MNSRSANPSVFVLLTTAVASVAGIAGGVVGTVVTSESIAAYYTASKEPESPSVNPAFGPLEDLLVAEARGVAQAHLITLVASHSLFIRVIELNGGDQVLWHGVSRLAAFAAGHQGVSPRLAWKLVHLLGHPGAPRKLRRFLPSLRSLARDYSSVDPNAKPESEQEKRWFDSSRTMATGDLSVLVADHDRFLEAIELFGADEVLWSGVERLARFAIQTGGATGRQIATRITVMFSWRPPNERVFRLFPALDKLAGIIDIKSSLPDPKLDKQRAERVAGAGALANAKIEDLVAVYEAVLMVIEECDGDDRLWRCAERLASHALAKQDSESICIARSLLRTFDLRPPPLELRLLVPRLKVLARKQGH